MNPQQHLFFPRRIVSLALFLSLPASWAMAQAPPPGPVALPEALAPTAAPIETAPATKTTVVPGIGAKPNATVPKEGILLNFQGASLSDVLNYLSEAAGFVILQEAPVAGTVNVVSRQPVSADEAVDLVNAVLIEKGYVALRSGRILKIVNRKDAQKYDLPVVSGSDPQKIPRKDEVVTQILPLRYGDATKLIENLRPLLSESTTITANESSNAIMMTDTQTNIRRIAQIIEALGESVQSISHIRVFQLQFADAKEVATIITQLFATSSTGRSDDQRRGFPGFPGFGGFGRGGPGGGGGDRGGRGGAQTAGQSEARQAASRVVAVADEQSNSVVVTASDDAMTTIAEVVAQLDTTINDITENRIFRLLHADAVELAELITNLYSDSTNSNQRRRGGGNGGGGGGGDGRGGGDGNPGGRGGSSQRSERALLQSKIVAVGDPRTNSVVVTAARETMMQIAEMVGRLDATDAKKQRVYVHSLEHADADAVAGVLRGMLGEQSGLSGGRSQNDVSRLTERSSTGATMENADQLSGGRGTGGGRR